MNLYFVASVYESQLSCYADPMYDQSTIDCRFVVASKPSRAKVYGYGNYIDRRVWLIQRDYDFDKEGILNDDVRKSLILAPEYTQDRITKMYHKYFTL